MRANNTQEGEGVEDRHDEFCSAHEPTVEMVKDATDRLLVAVLDITILRTTMRNTAIGAAVVWAVIMFLGGAYVKAALDALSSTVSQVAEMNLRNLRQELNIDAIKEWKVGRDKWQASIDQQLAKINAELGIKDKEDKR